MDRGWQNFEVHYRKSLDCLEKIVGRNMKAEDSSAEDLRWNEECDFGNNFGKVILIINWQKT